MGEIFERTAPVVALPWTGERLTTETTGQVEIEHLHRYFFARELCRGLDVLDVASGEGYGAALLAQVARSVTGVEISADAVAHAKAAYPKSNVTFLEGDARRLPCQAAQFDAVVSFETLEHFYEHEAFLAEIRRVLRPGGLLIISSPERDVYSPAGMAPNPYHVHELTHEEFETLLEAHFGHVTMYAQRPLLGSALVAERVGGPAAPMLTFERRDSRLFEVSTGLPRPIYLVAIASDREVAANLGSLYIETSGVEAIYGNAAASAAQLRSLTERLEQSKAQAEAAQDAAVRETEASRAAAAEQLRLAEELAARFEAEATQCRAQAAARQEEVQQLKGQLAAREQDYADLVQSSAERLKQRAARYERHEAALRASAADLARRYETVASAQRSEMGWREPQAGARLPPEYADLGRIITRSLELEAQLQAVLQSSSWQITGPLRGFAERHPGAIEGVRSFLGRHPRIRSAALGTARGGWRMVTGRRTGAPSAEAAIPPPPAPSLPAPVELRRLELREITPGPPADKALPFGGGRRALCVGHVMPYPPRAGNEYRIHRMLSWLASQGWDLLIVICPLPHEMPDAAQMARAAAIYPNLLIVDRAGLLHHRLQDGAQMLAGLSGGSQRDLAALLHEDARGDPGQERILNLVRTFCPDPLIDVLLCLQDSFRPNLLLAEYIFMTRPFALFDPGLIKAIDTIDVFSTKASKVEQHGVSDGLAMSEAQEAELLRRADIVIAIQDEEARALARLAPGCRVVSVGVDFDFYLPEQSPEGSVTVLLVASANPMNVKGLQDFLQFAWPTIRREAPRAELVVAGAAGEALDSVPDGVRVLGRVEDVGPLYAEARVVINPAIAGTGLKIKTIEALCHLRPIVCWPAGTDGLPVAARVFCHVAADWFSFARNVIWLLQNDDAARAVVTDGAEMIRCFSPATVYAPLTEALQDA